MDEIQKQAITYTDHEGRELPHHDGTAIYVENEGFLFFNLDGAGFLHDGAMVKLPDGRSQFFLHNGKAIIHDGSPLELPDGRMQYFDSAGTALWPVDEKKLNPLFSKQRDAFFEERIAYINGKTPLDKNHIEELRLALLAAEHPDYIDKNIKTANLQEGKKIKLEPLSEDTKGYLILLKGFWVTIWTDFQLRHREVLAARHILEHHKKNNCPTAKSSLSESILINELTSDFKNTDRLFNFSYNFYQIINLTTTKDGLFALDDSFLKYCKKHYPGKSTSLFTEYTLKHYQEKNFNIKSRIEAWQQPLFMYRCLAEIIWNETIKRRVEALRKKPPALTYIVNEQVHRPMRNGTQFNPDEGKITDHRGNELAVIDINETSKVLPSMNIDVIQKILIPENVKVLSTVNAHRLLRWEIQTVTRQFVEGMVDARALKVYGGYQELANRLGIGNNRRAAEQLRDIIVWQAVPRFYQPNGRYGNMLSFDYTPSGRGKPAVLQLVLGNMMLPHYVYELLNMPHAYVSDRRLIPIVDMPPLIGRSNEQGAQPSYQIEILVEMRKAAKEFATNGCVLIPKNKLEELAEKAGLNRRLYLKVIDRWLQDGTDAPAFLKTINEDRYALGNNYKQAQDFIIQAGKKEIAMSKAGQKSVSRRNMGIFKDK